MSRVATVPIPADAGIFGLIDRRVARQIVALAENDRYFPGLRGWVGFRQAGVVVERNARYDEQPAGVAGRAGPAGQDGDVLLLDAAAGDLPRHRARWRRWCSSGVSGFSLFCKLFTTLAIPGWTSFVLIGSFFGGLNALGISILGEYVIRIYDQVRGRPLYLVDRTVNMETGTGAVAVDDMAGDRPYEELMEQAESLLQQGGAAQSADLAAGNSDGNAAENEDAAPPVLLPIDRGE